MVEEEVVGVRKEEGERKGEEEMGEWRDKEKIWENFDEKENYEEEKYMKEEMED
jgi:hypothetical protein